MEPSTKLISQVSELARQAGAHIMRFYGGRAAVTWKKDTSPLTAADRASHDFLVEALKFVLPEAPVVSEESNESMNSSVDGTASFWLVDPLDGTKEFLKETNEFTVNIALIEGGVPVLGVVHAPAVSLTYYGGRHI